MKRGQRIEKVRIDGIGYKGIGVATAEDGRKILVKGALPQSVVDVEVVKKRRDYVQCRVVYVHEVAEQWVSVTPTCAHYQFGYVEVDPEKPVHKTGCGGCTWQTMQYAQQIQLKESILAECFQPLGDEWQSVSVLSAPQELHYRNKIEFSFGTYLKRNYDAQGKAQEGFSVQEYRNLGFHKQGEFSKIIDVDQCYLVSQEVHEVYAYLKSKLETSGLPVYDAKTHQGLLRHLMLRQGVRTGEVMVVLSYASAYLQHHSKQKKIWQKVLSDWKQDEWLQKRVSTFLLLENNGLADILRSSEPLHVLRGAGAISETLVFADTEVHFQISPFSFFQTNSLGAELLFTTGAKLLGEVQGNIIDLYCGSGTIGLSLLAQGIGQRVKGIDIVESAIHDAKHNAQRNGLQDSAEFFAGKAEVLLQQGCIDTDFFVGGDVIIVDPPREGLHKHVVAFLQQMKAQHQYTLLYISCNPTTMVRDLLLLQEGDFEIEAIQGVDMFPQTYHIEVVALLT